MDKHCAQVYSQITQHCFSHIHMTALSVHMHRMYPTQYSAEWQLCSQPSVLPEISIQHEHNPKLPPLLSPWGTKKWEHSRPCSAAALSIHFQHMCHMPGMKIQHFQWIVCLALCPSLFMFLHCFLQFILESRYVSHAQKMQPECQPTGDTKNHRGVQQVWEN